VQARHALCMDFENVFDNLWKEGRKVDVERTTMWSCWWYVQVIPRICAKWPLVFKNSAGLCGLVCKAILYIATA